MINCRYCQEEFDTEQAMNSHIGKSHKGVTFFKPSQDQLKWLASALDPEVSPTLTAIAIDCGVNREQWYRWKDDPDFVTWWNTAWQKAMEENTWWLDKVGVMKSPKDFRYWEAMQMKHGKFKRAEETTVNIKSTLGELKKLIEDDDEPEDLENNQ